MTPSLTLERPLGSTDLSELEQMQLAALSLRVEPTSAYNSRHALLSFAATKLDALARRQNARLREPYAIVHRLIAALIGGGSATPQIADNGEGGVEVLWLVNATSLTIDYEDELEILLTGVRADGSRAFAHTLTAYWTENDNAIAEARSYLADLSSGVRHAIPLN
ncbi:MAG: hypothetical protein REI45_01170 [Propionicimonas sp.]|nr:hypothetical protein [Propionicimonas sp.]